MTLAGYAGPDLPAAASASGDLPQDRASSTRRSEVGPPGYTVSQPSGGPDEAAAAASFIS
jgi:hypothetical protein